MVSRSSDPLGLLMSSKPITSGNSPVLALCDPKVLGEGPKPGRVSNLVRVVADVWEKDVWDFQAKSGSSGSCRLFLSFPRENCSSINVCAGCLQFLRGSAVLRSFVIAIKSRDIVHLGEDFWLFS